MAGNLSMADVHNSDVHKPDVHNQYEAQLLVRRLRAWLDSASGFLSTPD
jgi:hypothetical protein